MRYTSARVGLKRTVQPRQYESVTFELAVDVDLTDELDVDEAGNGVAGTGGCDPEVRVDRERFDRAVRAAYDHVAALIVAERKRRLKQVDDVVVGEKINGLPVVDAPAPGR